MSKITDQFRESALRQGVIIRTQRDTEVPENIRLAAVVEMANYGFIVSVDDLRGMSQKGLTDMLSTTRRVVGADRDMTPIYPGFPKQVEDLDTITLLVEQIMHYWTGGEFLPDYPDVAREGLPLEDMVRKARKAEVLTATEAAKHFLRTLTTRGVALSEDERALLDGSVALWHPDMEFITTTMNDARNGENKQALFLALIREGVLDADTAITAGVSTAYNADQILRLVLAAVATPVEDRTEDFERAVNNLRDADATALRMNTIKRPTRRALVTRLGQVTKGFGADALVARKTIWRRVMRMVHPYSVVGNDSDARRALDIIHSNVEYRTLNSLVEEAMAAGNIEKAVSLLAENAPGNLLRRLVALLRLVKTRKQADLLADSLTDPASRASITTLVSAYNGVIAANDTHARVTRAAGLNNAMVTRDVAKVDPRYVGIVSGAILDALRIALSKKDAPKGAVGTVGENAVPLVRRDLASTDTVMNRGDRVSLENSDQDTLRVFSHWTNTQSRSGYIDLGVAILDKDFGSLAVLTWNSWNQHRGWGTYSGDKNVRPGDTAAEYFDIKMSKVRETFPNAAWVVMTLQSYSGFPVADVDLIAGVMHRSKPNSGEVFDPRSVVTSFQPTTKAMQSIPLAVDLSTDEMIWLDSSSGSTDTGVSAVNDSSIGSVVYDEVARPRLSLGEFARLWAEAHDAKTADEKVDVEALLALLD